MALSKIYPFECIRVDDEEKKVMEIYKMMVKDGKEEGYTPIIILEDANDLMQDNVNFAIDDFGSLENFTKECLKKYKEINIQEYLDSKKEEYEEDNCLTFDEGDMLFEESNTVYLGEKSDKIYIAKIPTSNPYEVMAYIPMGGFNDCPNNEIHMALAKVWYDKYGAVPVCIGSDTIQFLLKEPVKGENELKELAMQQYLYCGDIVWQGVQTVNNLENSLSNSKVWYFWWD